MDFRKDIDQDPMSSVKNADNLPRSHAFDALSGISGIEM